MFSLVTNVQEYLYNLPTATPQTGEAVYHSYRQGNFLR